MSWTRVRLDVRCSRCPVTVAAGQLARFGDRTPDVWCAACALRCLGEAPPEDAPVEEAAPVLRGTQRELTFDDGQPAGDRRFKRFEARQALEEVADAIGRPEWAPRREARR